MSIKNIPNKQFASSGKERKVMLWFFIAAIVLVWIFLAVICLKNWRGILTDSWDTEYFVIAVVLSFLVVLGIPFQLVRYFRELRKL